MRTVELLGRVLPAPPARVLDVGGGTGIHARWLARDGYDVTLVDLMAEHVERAATIEGVHASVGEARSLAAPDASFDVVLLLGPLYHLTDACPSKIEIGALKAGAPEVLMETVTMTCEFIQRVSI